MHAGIALGLLLSKHGSLHGQLLTEVLHRTNLRAVLQAKFGLNVNAWNLSIAVNGRRMGTNLSRGEFAQVENSCSEA